MIFPTKKAPERPFLHFYRRKSNGQSNGSVLVITALFTMQRPTKNLVLTLLYYINLHKLITCLLGQTHMKRLYM